MHRMVFGVLIGVVLAIKLAGLVHSHTQPGGLTEAFRDFYSDTEGIFEGCFIEVEAVFVGEAGCGEGHWGSLGRM